MPALAVASVCSTKAAATAARPQVSAPALLVPRLKAAAVATAAAALLGGAAPAFAADLALGEEVFNNNCAACHMGGNNSVQVEKTLRRAALEQYLDGGFNQDAIIYQVENGKNAMPAWEGRLSEEEIQAVAAFVFKQAEGDLW